MTAKEDFETKLVQLASELKARVSSEDGQWKFSSEGERIMATLDWSQCPAVESIPGKVSGAWIFRGTRVPVSAVFENLKTSPMEEILENFHVTREQVQTVLDFAAKSAQAHLHTLQAG